MKQGRVPMRMCNGCGKMFDKRELVRVVKSPEKLVSLDLSGKKPGRGAYVCKSLPCLQKANKNHRIERTFSMQIPPEVWQQMEEVLTKDE